MKPLTAKSSQLTAQQGFSLVEVLLSSAVFILLVTALVGAYLYGQESTMLAGNRARATLLAEEGLEAARNIRDSSSTNLTDGTFGLTITGNQWNLSGASDTVGIFTRQVVIVPIDTKRKSVTANVTWQQNPQRTGSVSAVTRFTNWQISNGCTGSASNSLSVDTASAHLDPADNTRVIGMAISNCGGANIILDKMTVSWTGGPSGNRVQAITINGNSAWTGNKTSGTLLNITNFTLDPLVNSYAIDFIGFKKNMTGTNISIVFTMTDGSTKTVSDITP